MSVDGAGAISYMSMLRAHKGERGWASAHQAAQKGLLFFRRRGAVKYLANPTYERQVQLRKYINIEYIDAILRGPIYTQYIVNT